MRSSWRSTRRPSRLRPKHDRSPVTEADQRAEALIEAALARLARRVPIVVRGGGRTRAACRRSRSASGWSIRSTARASSSPQRRVHRQYRADRARSRRARRRVRAGAGTIVCRGRRRGASSRMRQEDARRSSPRALRAPGSRSCRAARTVMRRRSTPTWPGGGRNATLRGLVAQVLPRGRGEADLYPRFGRTMEWDTAAGHAVLEAGGRSGHRP